MDGHNTHFVGHHVSIFLFKKKDDSRGKKKEKLWERRVEKNAQTWVSELYSHGERIIISHNIRKRCKWDQWTMVRILWRVWRIWMMSKACGEINASANLKRVKKIASVSYLSFICLFIYILLYQVYIGLEGFYIKVL